MNTTSMVQYMRSLRCILFLLTSCLSMIELYAQGLQFYGYEKRIDERASYQVFEDDKLPDFSDEISVAFEYSAQELTSPGYILFLKDKKNTKAYNLTYLYNHFTGISSFMFSEDGKKIYHTTDFKGNDIKCKWIPISLRIHPKLNQADIRIGNDSVQIKDIGLQDEFFSPQLYFGMCDYILEIASFSIRNLSVSNGKKTWRMPLNESHSEEVHDAEGNIIGHVKNPVWLINQSYYWEPCFNYSSASPAGFVFDKRHQKMFIYNEDSLITYNWYTKESTAKPYFNSPTINLRLGMNFLDEETSNVYAYELTEGKMISRLSTLTTEWEEIKNDASAPYLYAHHHCGFYHPAKKKLLIFGGYGNRSYSDMFLSYDIGLNRWDTIHFSGDRILPRFFAGMAVSPDYKRIYVYGGKGNESGDQNIGLEYFYDLYQIDMEKHTIRKLWNHPPPKMNRIVARNMILSKDEKSIYFLGYPEYIPHSYLQLYRMEIANGTYEALGDSIPMISEEIATNANLYYDDELGKFYCSIQEFEKFGETTTRIYSLVAPPVSLEAVRYYDLRKTKDIFWLKYSIVMIVITIFGLFSFYFISRKRKRSATCTTIIESFPTENKLNVPKDTQIADSPNEATLEIMEVHFRNRNAIYLWGTFAVLDRNGKDITYLFSPKLRTIFLYILLNSVSGDGVLSSDMNELFWPEKTDDKVKNLKGVTINHIRKLLQEIDGIELVYEKGRFHLEFHCDYVRFSHLLKNEKVITLDKEVIDKLLKILVRGKFLNGIDHELFDYYKHKIEEHILTIIPSEIDKAYKAAHFTLVIRLCNVWTSVDPLSEQALYYAVGSYQKLNHPTEALKRYNSFITTYKKAMNEEYTVKYENISSPTLKT